MELIAFPAIITNPGRYYITNNVMFASTSNVIDNIITVNSTDVTIDLMGNSISITDEYKLRNRYINIIYSEHSIHVINGKLEQCSGYSIKGDKNVYCSNITFNKYELGAIIAEYISITDCIVLSPNTTNTTISYDTSMRLIATSTSLISNYSTVLPINIVHDLTIRIMELQNLLDFALNSYYQSIYYPGYFTSTQSYRCIGILIADKIKTCTTQILIPIIDEFIYNQERLISPTNDIIVDISNSPLQYNTTITIQQLRELTWFSSNIVGQYSLPYPNMPQVVIDALMNNTQPPSGYIISSLTEPIIILRCRNLKLFNTIISVPDTTTSINITSSRYVRCHKCTIGGIFNINSSKSIKIMSSNIIYINISNIICIKLCDNVIGFISMTNPNVIIKSA